MIGLCVQMELAEIVLPETEPETEWVRGRPLQKVSPTRTHAKLQLHLGGLLTAWARGRGEVGSEWRFRVAPPGTVRRPLVPDLAFISNDRLRGLSYDDAECPALAPDVAIEILSPDDRKRDVDHKIGVYLSAGSQLVIIIDPLKRSVALHDGSRSTLLREAAGDVLRHSVLPGFSVRLADLFAVLALPQ